MELDLPHHEVWCRLGASPLHGVGVFAIVPIPAGTDVFGNDSGEIVWIEASDIVAQPTRSAKKRLYSDFAIRRGTLLGCPVNFNMLSVGWYVNEPGPGDEANLRITDEYAMIARRSIEAGEELTIVYATFSRDASL
jgi:hypothetical protein